MLFVHKDTSEIQRWETGHPPINTGWVPVPDAVELALKVAGLMDSVLELDSQANRGLISYPDSFSFLCERIFQIESWMTQEVNRQK